MKMRLKCSKCGLDVAPKINSVVAESLYNTSLHLQDIKQGCNISNGILSHLILENYNTTFGCFKAKVQLYSFKLETSGVTFR